MKRWLVFATHVPPSLSGGGMVRVAVDLVAALARRSDIDLHVLVRPESVLAFETIGIASGKAHGLRGGIRGEP